MEEDLKRKYTFVKCNYDDQSGNPEAHYDKLCSYFFEVKSMVSKTKKSRMIMMTCIDKLKEKFRLNESSNESASNISLLMRHQGNAIRCLVLQWLKVKGSHCQKERSLKWTTWLEN